ncbi:MAG: PIG-L deacetylase family protein [Acidobacteriota bacterium]
MLSYPNNVLVIAAHPDDEVLGVGGTIPILRSKGARVTVLMVTEGSSTQYKGDDGAATAKRSQMKEANRIIGTDELAEWDFPDMRLDTVEHQQLNSAFNEFLHTRGFDTVFVHGDIDINLDHQIIYRSLMVAARPHPAQPVRTVLTYQVNSSTEWGGQAMGRTFAPNLYIQIDETIETKLAAMAAYKDELRPYPHPRSIRALRERAAVYGTEVGYRFAEAFRLILSR